MRLQRVLASMMATLLLFGVTAIGSSLPEEKNDSSKIKEKAAKMKAVMMRSHKLAVKRHKEKTMSEKAAKTKAIIMRSYKLAIKAKKSHKIAKKTTEDKMGKH